MDGACLASLSDLHLGCTSARYADIVKRAISVEPELRPAMVTRSINGDTAGSLHMYKLHTGRGERAHQRRILS